jgi:hypothetical protein
MLATSQHPPPSCPPDPVNLSVGMLPTSQHPPPSCPPDPVISKMPLYDMTGLETNSGEYDIFSDIPMSLKSDDRHRSELFGIVRNWSELVGIGRLGCWQHPNIIPELPPRPCQPVSWDVANIPTSQHPPPSCPPNPVNLSVGMSPTSQHPNIHPRVAPQTCHIEHPLV